MYGANGIAGFTYKKNGVTSNYYYRKNLLGDIVAVYGENGTKYAEYAYDSWGNCTIIVNSNGIATLNPFRYRGYYWDSEFGLYYLNARYYDPEVGRFISQDSINYIAPTTLNGLNLFAYCLNNPIFFIDSTGLEPAVNVGVDLFTLINESGCGVYSGRYIPKRQFIPALDFEYLGNNLLYLGEQFISKLDVRVFSWKVELLSVSLTGFTLASLGVDAFDVRYNFTESEYIGVKLGTAKLELFDFDFSEDFKLSIIDAQATIATVGVYTEYVDAELLCGSVGFTFKFENGTLTIGASYGWGFKLSVNFGKIFGF